MPEQSNIDQLRQARWRAFLTGDQSAAPPPPPPMRVLDKAWHGLLAALPSDPRCIECNVPFRGPAGSVMRGLGWRRSDLTPHLCTRCDTWIKHYQLGAEVELSMLFADVRGSTALAERLDPAAFHQLINRFYTATTGILVQSYALIDKLAGDEVAAFYVPGIAGPDYTRRAVEAAQELLRVTGHDDPEGPWVPVGAGVHTGVAYVGAVGSPDGMTDITALGDDVNIAARLASQAGPGEIIVSQSTLAAAGLPNTGNFPSRQLQLKGKAEALDVSVIRVQPA